MRQTTHLLLFQQNHYLLHAKFLSSNILPKNPNSPKRHHKQSKHFKFLAFQASLSKKFVCRSVNVRLCRIKLGNMVNFFKRKTRIDVFTKHISSKIAKICPIGHCKDCFLLIDPQFKCIFLMREMKLRRAKLPTFKVELS